MQYLPSASIALKPRARLTDDQVIQIFKSKLNSPRLSSTVLATLYHVNEKTVRDIWKGRTWSKETRHLDTSRPLQQKQLGRPKGRRDTQPRKRRASGILHRESSPSKSTGAFSDELSRPGLVVKIGLAGQDLGSRRNAADCDHSLKSMRYQLSVQGYETVCADEFTEECSDSSSSWLQSDPSLWYNTVERKPPSTQRYASMDEQLHDWGVFWRSLPIADPFRSDWTTKPLEYA